MAIMATVSTVMLGIGEQSLLLPVLTLLAAVASVLLTDMLGWFSLNRYIANLAMLLAAVFSLWGFLEAGSRQQLSAIAHLLTYVQMVLLFQQKQRRVYGQIAMFSLLQVVVASLLNNRLEFGVLLAGYLVVAIGAFVLFFVYREVARVGMIGRRQAWWEWGDPAPVGAELANDGLPLLSVEDVAATLNQRIVTRNVVPPITAMLLVTIVLTVVLFYITPRSGGANWEGGGAGKSMVGFAPEVSFDDMGRLLLNQARVMRVSFTDARGGEPYTVIGDPYLRGAILTTYVTVDGHGRWAQVTEPRDSAGLALPSPPATRDLVRQDVLLEATGNNRLFSMFPAYAIAQTSKEIKISPMARRLFRANASDRQLRDEYRYTLVTTAFRFGSQVPVIPHYGQVETEEGRKSLDRYLLRHRFIDNRQAFPRLIAQARQIVQEQTPHGTTFERARALEAHFTEGDRYTYTLDMDAINEHRESGVDPIEDFVGNHRTGHCEYFASALTLMLRSQGIPARMVVGYRGGEYNYVGNYYLVRQCDAHAWVEAYLAPDEIPPESAYPQERHAGGGWLRLDPTPSDDDDELGELTLLDRASKSFDYARWLWNDYVTRLTEERQRNAVLEPLALERRFSLAGLLRVETWKNLGQKLTGTSLGRLLRGEFSWRGTVAALIACGAVFLAYRLIWSLWPLLRTMWPRRTERPRFARHASVDFYRRLESSLARLGLRRETTQTQRQFAREASQRLAASPHYARVSDIPDQLAAAFYQVRFGRQTPDPQQAAQIQQLLQTLEQALRQPSA